MYHSTSPFQLCILSNTGCNHNKITNSRKDESTILYPLQYFVCRQFLFFWISLNMWKEHRHKLIGYRFHKATGCHTPFTIHWCCAMNIDGNGKSIHCVYVFDMYIESFFWCFGRNNFLLSFQTESEYKGNGFSPLFPRKLENCSRGDDFKDELCVVLT